MPKDKNGRRREAAFEERVDVIERRAARQSYGKIAKDLGMTKSGASGSCRIGRQNKIYNAPHPGAPKKLTGNDERYLCQLSTRNPRATLRDITGDSQLNVSERLVGDTLRKHHLYVRVCRRKPWLDKDSRLRRKQWARVHKDKPMWRKYVYTDEVSSKLGQATNA